MNKIVAIFFAFIVIVGWQDGFAEETTTATTTFEEGKQYQRLPKEVEDNALVKEQSKPNQIHILEFFSYGCAGCYKLDPTIETWRKQLPNNIDFQRVPVGFHAEWGNLTKAYYTVLNLNAFDKIHMQIFDAIHQNKLTSSSNDALRDFFTTNGIEAKDFDKTFDSFDVNRKLKWANALTRAYRVTAIPAVIVQGKNGIYFTTAKMAGSQEDLLKLLDFLIKLEDANPSEQSNQAVSATDTKSK